MRALQKTADHLVNEHRMAKFLFGVRDSGSALMNWMVDPKGKIGKTAYRSQPEVENFKTLI